MCTKLLHKSLLAGWSGSISCASNVEPCETHGLHMECRIFHVLKKILRALKCCLFRLILRAEKNCLWPTMLDHSHINSTHTYCVATGSFPYGISQTGSFQSVMLARSNKRPHMWILSGHNFLKRNYLPRRIPILNILNFVSDWVNIAYF